MNSVPHPPTPLAVGHSLPREETSPRSESPRVVSGRSRDLDHLSLCYIEPEEGATGDLSFVSLTRQVRGR